MVAALVWMAGVAMAWGQDYVTGDKYNVAGIRSTVKATADKQYVTDKDGEHSIDKAFDDNDGTWWKASESGKVTVTLTFGEKVVIGGMSIWRSANPKERSKEIRISYSDDGNNYQLHHTQSNIPKGNDGNDRYTFCFPLSIETQYLKLEFTPYEDVSAFNEIDFLAEIQHKPAKWYDLRGSIDYGDTFDDKNESDKYYGPIDRFVAEQMQAAHTIIDTIYMHRGESIELKVPDYLNNDVSSPSYQRWYSLRTGKTFATTKAAPVTDILTPKANNLYYRFSNGYVGAPITTASVDHYTMNFYMPTETQFSDWFEESKNFDGNWYVIACDLSCYTDYTEKYDPATSPNSDFMQTFTEPTLSHRIIYYIRAVDENDEVNWYNKAWKKQSDTDFLEEYEINMPFTRYPDERKNDNDVVLSYIYEMVALSKDARSYADPEDEEAPSEVELTVSLGSNTAGIVLQPQKTNNGQYILKGTDRAIFFDYPVSNTQEGTKSVKEDVVNPMAEIIVKKGSKNLVKFTLNFTKGTSLMTQSMISQLEDEEKDLTDKSWGAYRERTPKYLESNFEFLTGLDFDFREDVAKTFDDGEVKIYPFPLGWDDCSYGFYDGSTGKDMKGTNTVPQWGYYSIINAYLEASSKKDKNDWGWNDHIQTGNSPETSMENRKGEKSSYHMYIDASDRPGVIARLPFEGTDLCPGTELFVSAWVKSAKWGKSSDNAAMLFSFMGVKKANGQTLYEPLYRHQTGQIPATYMSDIKLPGFKSESDKGNQSNEWFQIAFSFITDGNILADYTDFVLQVENNSASTNGGDMYLDDVRIYMAKPQAEVKQKEATCGNERTRLNFSMDWDRLLSRTGEPDLAEGETVENRPALNGDSFSGIGLCFIDKWKYESGSSLDESVVHIGANDGDGSVNNYKYAAVCYKLDYDKNTKYSDGQSKFEDGALAKNNGWFFYYDDTKEDEAERTLTVDFYAEIQPYRPYIMLVIPLGDYLQTLGQIDIAGIRKYLADNANTLFGGFNDDACAIKTEVYVTSESLITVDGSVVNPSERYCQGQILNFSVDLRAPTGTGGELEAVKEDVYFDWFFGTEEEFTTKNSDEISLEEALLDLRDEYPDAESVDNLEPIEKFTLQDKKLILQYSTSQAEGVNPRLVLHRRNLNIMLLEELNLIIQPIRKELQTVDEDKINVCWNYIPLHLETTGESPKLHMGFDNVPYTEEPNLRIGREQIEGANSKDSPLQINLRGIELINDEGELSMHTNNEYVYLVDSNDPLLTFPDDFDPLSLPVGRLHKITANKDGELTNSMYISFDLEGALTKKEGTDFTFNPREGYEYELRIYFQQNIEGKQATNLCEGILTFTMKVVPEYQRWIGGPTSNWNKDENWVRASKAQLNNRNDYEDYSEKARGYVPMDFTNVIIPTPKESENISGKIHLYGEQNKATGHEPISLVATDHYVDEEPTTNIQYDLLVKKADGNGYECEPYYTNTVNQIHFEPGARILHAEKLGYNKAWVDYQLTRGQWYMLASPLKEIYAGDFYTGEEGKETVPYFSDIKFDGHSRIKPPVYQRSWIGKADLIRLEDSNLPGDVAINGNWSSVYNDVTVSYSVGSGFSLKVPGNNSETVTFRLPKKDTKYAYFKYENGATVETGKSGEVSKTDGKNLNTGDISVTPVKKEVGGVTYYLVGNPYMTDLNLTLFLAENQHLQPKYWVVTEGTQQSVVGEVSNISEADGIATIPPLQSFFVTPNEENQTSGDIEIEFTPSMQTMEGYESQGGENGTNTDMLFLTVETSNGRQSHASIVYDAAASETYEASEDAELFLDSNLGDLPMVYTAAGTMAASINRTSGLYNIPVGVYAPGAKGETVSLTFSGVDGFSYATLYDAETRTETPIREGSRFTVPANTAGRYFLRAGVPTANEAVQESAIRIYTVGGGTLVVASTDLLRTVRVYDFAGRLVANETGLRTTQCRIELPEGSYIVKAESEKGEEEVKIRM